jgi:hypothetical protein
MRAPKTDPTTTVIIGAMRSCRAGVAGTTNPASTRGNRHLRVAAACDELAEAI